MNPEEFERTFKKISEVFTLESLAEEIKLEGDFPKRSPNESIWACIDELHNGEFIDLGNGKFFRCKFFFKRPVRILFAILLSEIEARLFRIHERAGKNIEELNEKTLKELIVELLNSDGLFKLQKEYETKRKLKDDLKAISLFRNVIVHTNKKLEKTITSDTISKRKRQILKLLEALQQISDNLADKETLKN
jgi:hypothetical protein